MAYGLRHEDDFVAPFQDQVGEVPVFGVGAPFAIECLRGEFIYYLFEERCLVSGQATAATDYVAQIGLSLLIYMQADPVVESGHFGQPVLLFVRELHVAGRSSYLGVFERFDDFDERVLLQDSVGIYGHDEVRITELFDEVIQRLALAAIFGEAQDFDALFAVMSEHRLDIVSRAVVDYDQFFVAAASEDGFDRGS